MIEISTKIHDRFSIEFKVGFVTEQEYPKDDFLLGMWIFVPGSLDITPSTFTKIDFYRYFKSNVRLITPRFPLSEIAGGQAVPLNSVRNAGDDYDYQLKMFVSIVKSSLRNERSRIISEPDPAARRALCLGFIKDTGGILKAYEDLEPRQEWKEAYGLCGEFLCNVCAESIFKVMDAGECRPELTELMRTVSSIRERNGYARVSLDDPALNRDYVYRHGAVKKYAEGQLYLRAPRTRDGFLAEQAYYSVAAGLAMLFATIVAWAFQKQFGNLTWPLFIALIISYMLKDRIKELTRYYFAHKVGSKYYDNKAEVSHKNHRIGYFKEGMDFVGVDKVPGEVIELRGKSPVMESGRLDVDEKIILYRKMVHIDRDALNEISTYRHEGINDIIRLQVEGFLHKADNPVTNVGYLDADGQVLRIPCEKDYFLNIIFQYNHESAKDYRRFRVMMNRDGIKNIEEIA